MAALGVPSSVRFLLELINNYSPTQPSSSLVPLPRPMLPSSSNNASLFVHSAVNSASGYELSDAVTRRLENIGLPVASDKTNGGLNIVIESLTVERPQPDNADHQLSWTVTVNARIIIRRAKDNLMLLTKDFAATTNPATDSPDTARAAALLRVADGIVSYLDSNRQTFTLQSH